MSTSTKPLELKRYEREEQQRFQAAPLFARGCTKAQVARALGVSRKTAGEWFARWQAGGVEGLRSHKPGPVPRLTEVGRQRLAQALVAGPEANGINTPLWTLGHIAELIQKMFGVKYHPGYVWYLLHAMGFSCQKPQSRAVERDEEAIAAWKQTKWPAIKRGRRD